ncbi:hypothetical protein BU25DRAFT_414485 [Macroventuria anomochaeta]|uniref:Uncharacterized protein n=1 Tax=Macroventuria anomochaeta TaxID=301207 RepID=A0ACB6RPM6_9PLEO|nr:uncharacterized protein BU25DRAFT_414485 [Macroventuria anomochaeta]KAF2623217.1 hypothetical protein BU25DRAFT_414485 [Macroventuria anomochaeta]
MVHQRQGWYPPALRWWNLILAILFCWTSIAVLQFYLHKSQTEGGLIFAAKINDIPLRRSFWYLYLPTIVAVIFSIFVVWIDHDAKRYEPYRQMSQSEGALAKDSILLHYPFDFVPFVPFVAAKRKHWLVFWASLTAVLTTFGIVPLQASILSVKQTTRTYPETFAVSSNFIPSSMQESGLGLRYAQSAYGILELNETLPSFMSRNYTLAPFKAKTSHAPSGNLDTWTTNTTVYSMDMQCQIVDTFVQVGCDKGCREFPTTYFNTSAGCTVGLPDFVNNTIGTPLRIRAGISDGKARYKTFSTVYAGYYKDRSFPNNVNTTLQNSPCKGTVVAAFIRNKSKDTDPPNNITAIACRPSYYEQNVEATINVVTKKPLELNFHGPKRPLSEVLFNSSLFEGTVASAISRSNDIDRSDNLPGTVLPNYREGNNDLDLSPYGPGSGLQLPHMAAMAIAISEHRIADFLDPIVLQEAYESAYRLLFVRSMVDVLATNFSDHTVETDGQRVVRTETLLFEPTFTYLVECLLGLVSLSAIALLCISIHESGYKKLIDEPGSIAATMAMVADDPRLISTFEDLDCCSTPYMKRKLLRRAYILDNHNSQPHIYEAPPPAEAQQSLLHDPGEGVMDEPQVIKAIKPAEFRSYVAVPFTSLFVALLIILAITFAKSQPQGLPLPSRNPITYNIVVKYLPTAAATLIEPMWILINRLLCVLQPLERLRRSQAPASVSISLNYTSLPPQLMITKALRAGHLTIAAVCAMALLANLLATSFAGLFYQQEVEIARPSLFTPPFEARFANISRSTNHGVSDSDPVAWRLGEANDTSQIVEAPFLASETNYTRNTTMPAWVDDAAMYVPFLISNSTAQVPGGGYKARTRYFAANPNCKPLVFDQDYRLRLAMNWTPTQGSNSSWTFAIKVPSRNATDVWCYAGREAEAVALGPYFRDQSEDTSPPRGKTAVELLRDINSRYASRYEADTCQSSAIVGWMRTIDFGEAKSNNTFLMACQPKLLVGEADVHVDSNGVLQSPATNRSLDADQSAQALSRYTTNGTDNLIAQSNRILFRSGFSGYHNDSFTGEKFHYFINRAAGDLRFTDPNAPLPTYEDVIEPLTKAYQRLFAIWLSVNKDILFVPASSTTAQIPGFVVAPEQRLFLVTPLFIISEVILGIYIIVSIVVYLRRPGAYLPRMPTSIAAIIALFASSAAVRDLQGTSHMTNKERNKYLKELDCRYGYGSYVGGDGSVHVGIEKAPFVRHRKNTTFEGSRVEKEMSKRKEGEGAATITTVTEYRDVPLVDMDNGRR